MRNLILIAVCLPIVGCSSPEFRQEESICKAYALRLLPSRSHLRPQTSAYFDNLLQHQATKLWCTEALDEPELIPAIDVLTGAN